MKQEEKFTKNIVATLSFVNDIQFEALGMYLFIKKKGLLQEYKNDEEIQNKVASLITEASQKIIDEADKVLAVNENKAMEV